MVTKQVKRSKAAVKEALCGYLSISPWVLGFSLQTDATRNAVVSGLVVLGLALWVLGTDKDYSALWRRGGPAH